MPYNHIDDVVGGLLYADGYLAGIRDWLVGPYPEDAAVVNEAMQALDGLRRKFEAGQAGQQGGE